MNKCIWILNSVIYMFNKLRILMVTGLLLILNDVFHDWGRGLNPWYLNLKAGHFSCTYTAVGNVPTIELCTNHQ